MSGDVDDRASAFAIREELISSLDRWRGEVPAADEPGNTMWFGIAERAITLASALVRAVVDTLYADDPPRRPTLGERIRVIARRAPNEFAVCSSPLDRLATEADVVVLREFKDLRNDLAHQEDRQLDALTLGRYTPTRVATALDLVESIAHMTIVNETICVQAARIAPTARLIVNDDHSRCGHCGRGADPREATHLTAFSAAGASAAGCGARFVAVSSDSRMTPRLRDAIITLRPDLPIADEAVY